MSEFTSTIKKVSFAPSMEDFSRGGASQYSLFIHDDPEFQKARLLLKLKQYEKEQAELDYKIQELICDIERNEADCGITEKSTLPDHYKRDTLYLTRLYNSKRYCQIEVLRVEKKILDAQTEQEKQRYMDSLKPLSYDGTQGNQTAPH